MSARLEMALSVLAEHLSANPWREPEAAAVIAAKVRGLLRGYDARWSDAEWSLEGEPEQTVVLPIVNPETGKPSRTFRQAGKFDGVVTGYGRRALFEAKTTSDDIADPNSTYWRRLAIDSQVSTYFLLKWQEGSRFDAALYDVTRKPAIRPKRLTKADLSEISSRGTYCGFEVDHAEYEAVLRGQGDETPHLYELRLWRETLDEPERYYQRRMIPRLDADVAEYATELWAIADEIRLARLTGRHFRNSAACMEFGRACEYLGICSGYDQPDSGNWTRAENVHAELEIADGRDVLTNSRIKTFQRCRRLHHYRYEVGLRRIQEDEAEALYFGTAWHVALAAWWQAGATLNSSTPQGGEHDAPHHGSAVTAIAEPADASR